METEKLLNNFSRLILSHYRKEPDACACGWSAIGMAHSRHVASVLVGYLSEEQEKRSAEPVTFVVPEGMDSGEFWRRLEQRGIRLMSNEGGVLLIPYEMEKAFPNAIRLVI